MEELEQLLVRFGEEENRLLFFVPMGEGLRRRFKEQVDSRNQRLRLLFAGLTRPPPAGCLSDGGEDQFRDGEDDDTFVQTAQTKKRKLEDNEPEMEAGALQQGGGDSLALVASLPVEIWGHIISFLAQEEALLSLAPVNSFLRQLVNDGVHSASLRRRRFRTPLGQLWAKHSFLKNNFGHSLTSIDLSGWNDKLQEAIDEQTGQKQLRRVITNLPRSFPYLRTLNLTHSGASPECLAHFTSFQRLTTLHLDHCPEIDDKAMPLLPASLTRLSLRGQSVTDEGILKLPPSLTSLDLGECKLITPHGFNFLSLRLPALASLNLRHFYKFDEHYLAALPPSLTSLELLYSTMDHSIAPHHFRHLPRGLKRLWIREPRDGYLTHFPSQSLTSLSVIQCRHISAAGFESLGSLTNLRSLALASCDKPDLVALGFVGRLTNLESLQLSTFTRTTGEFYGWLPPSLRELSMRNVKNLRAQPDEALRRHCTISIVNPHRAAAVQNPFRVVAQDKSV